MAYMQSPGIEVKEYDVSTYVPGVSTSVAAIGGVFSWGPIEDRKLISNEEELTVVFGKPTDNNFETFLIATNYLAYSDALYVSRAADANAFNAVANTGAVANLQIKNDDDFTVKQPTLSANAHFYAKWPSDLGNSLKVSVCPSASAYQSDLVVSDAVNFSLEVVFTPNSFTVTVAVTDEDTANNTLATNELQDILDEIHIGDHIIASDPVVGTQYLSVGAISSISAATGTATAVLTVKNRFALIDTITMTKVSRAWEYYNVVDKAPGTSTFVAERGGLGDEIHIVVVDEDGGFTGTPGTLLEVWQAASRAVDSVNEDGTQNYYKTLINEGSRFLWAASDVAGITSGQASSMTPLTIAAYTASLGGGTNTLGENGIPLSALSRAYDQFKSKEDVDVGIIIAGKAMGGSHGEALANYIIDNIAEVRRDCVVTISPHISDVVNNPFSEVDDLIEFRNSLRSGSRGFLTSAYKWQFDRYNNKYRWVAGCGDDAGLMARTEQDRDAWWSPAGQNRGVYKNIIKLAFNPDKAKRDALYKNDVNPVVTMVGPGTMLYGDKTLLGKPSAFDRINVRRLFDVLEKAIERASRDLLFEFNDEFTRARFRSMVEPYLKDVKGRRGIVRFEVVCDERNNTPVVIDRNEFVGTIMIVPAKSINFITLNFVAVANTLSFDYVIQTFTQ